MSSPEDEPIQLFEKPLSYGQRRMCLVEDVQGLIDAARDATVL